MVLIPKIVHATTFVSIVDRPSPRLQPYENTQKFTLKKGNMFARIVAKGSFKKFTCKHTCSSILVANHGCAMSVEKVSSPMLFWRSTPSCIMAQKGHSIVYSVRPDMPTWLIWKFTKESILENCHLLAPNAKRLLDQNDYFRSMSGVIWDWNCLLVPTATRALPPPLVSASISNDRTLANWPLCPDHSAW